MIINNTASQIGDVLIFNPISTISGITSILNFDDEVEGVTGTRFFEKQFRYTVDGINWSEWMELSSLNLLSIAIDKTWDFNIQYKYIRGGSDVTGVLQWNWTNLITQDGSLNCGPTFSTSIFAYFLSCYDDQSMMWSINVLEKLYRPGIIMKAMTRGSDNNANQDDRDYIDFWRSITHFFALLVIYTRKFEQLDQDQRLLFEYLSQRGLYLRDDQSLQSLQDLMINFYREISKRGTKQIVSLDSQNEGELIRLIDHKTGVDEFMFDISDYSGGNGWILNVHSPLYRGTTTHKVLNKINSLIQSTNFFLFKLKAKGLGTTDINQLQIGDIVEGFKQSDWYWTSALYIGGDITDRTNYLPIEQATSGTLNTEYNSVVIDRNWPIPYLTLQIKTKGSSNDAEVIEIDDIVEGFKDSVTYWTSARYIGGDLNDRSSYVEIEESLIDDVTLIPTIVDFEWDTTPIPYGKLALKAKGIGNSDLLKLQAGDVVEGFKEANLYWTSALFLGGNHLDRANYLPLEQSSFVFDTPGSSSGGMYNVLPILDGSVVEIIEVDGEEQISIDTSDSQITGLGSTIPSRNLSMIVDSQLHYELSVLAKVTDINIPITVKMFGFNALGASINPVAINIFESTNIALNSIFLPKVDTFYMIKVSIFPFTQAYENSQSLLTTSLGVGNNLKMARSINAISIEISTDGQELSVQGKLILKQLRFQLSTTPYNKGFIGAQSIMEFWMKNNSLQHSNQQVSQALRYDLIPYKTGMINNFL